MTEPNRQSGENEERIIEIEIERLRPFKEHPFQVKDDKEMFLLQESIEKYGILNTLGGADEHAESTGGGNDLSRVYLYLELFLFVRKPFDTAIIRAYT